MRTPPLLLLRRFLCLVAPLLAVGSLSPVLSQSQSLSVYISVDMEGLTGIGSPEMTRNEGKDYGVGRRMMTREVNAVVEGIRRAAADLGSSPVRIVVNDSHGDHRNLLIEELAAGVEYVQSSSKPMGMVAQLDDAFDAAMFLGYHARAGSDGFLAHTGSGLVRDLRINGVPCGEGEMNAALAGWHGVPVVLVSGDRSYVEQARETYASAAETVVTKTAVTAHAAHLRPVDHVLLELKRKAEAAIHGLQQAEPWQLESPFVVELQFGNATHTQVTLAIPGVERTGPLSVRFEEESMARAYALIRLLYRFISV